MDEHTAHATMGHDVSSAADIWPYSAREAAAILGISERTVRRAIAHGKLAASKHAGVYRITPDALAAYGEQRRRGDATLATAGQRAMSGRLREPSSPPPMLRLVERAPASLTFTLPHPLTPFLGRERDIAAVTAALSQPDLRLLTLTGPGGTGKTRLALRVAEDVTPHVADGVAFVPLASVADASLVPSAIAQALGQREHGERPLGERLIAALRDRRLLLVLDNFEHVLPAAPFIAELLASCPSLTILVTSRTTLRLSGEQRFPVPPMALPDPATTTTAAAVRQADAVQLFVHRAQAAQPEFALTDENAGALAEICRRLDGLPLAIELAAARIAVLPPRALLERLDRRLPLLSGGPLDAPARLRTMRDAIAWSYDFLPPDRQVLFRRLAVFMGGCTLEAAATVAGVEGDVLEGISSLVVGSLLHQQDSPGGEPRYLMLETLREFGIEQLDASEQTEIRQRHAMYYLGLVERWSPEPALPGEKHRLAAIAPEYDNVRLALAWFDAHDEANGLLRLSGSLFEFWHARALYSEGRRWLQQALEGSERAAPPVRLRALMTACTLAQHQGDLVEATTLIDAALPLARELRNSGQLITALINAGLVAYSQERYGTAEVLLHEGLDIAHGLADSEPAKRPITGILLSNLGLSAFAQGHLDRAAALFAEAIAVQRAADYGWALDHSLAGLGGVYYCQGDVGRAAQLFAEALELAWAVQDPRKIAIALLGIAGIAAARGRATAGARLLGAAEAMSGGVGVPFAPSDRPVYDRVVAALTTALGEVRLNEGRTAGHSLPIERVIAEAGVIVRADEKEVSAKHRHGEVHLTLREIGVLRLMAHARTDREIAEALFLSRRTVNAHVARIFDKLEVHTRREAVERGHELGLLSGNDAAFGYT
jgi:excisionase family DNA binding protein